MKIKNQKSMFKLPITKIQSSNNNQYPITNNQTSRGNSILFGDWKIGHWNLFGYCFLEFGYLFSKFVLLFCILIFAFWILNLQGCAKSPQEKQAAQKEEASQKKIAYWTCAMHPSVRSDKPGKCPICGMDLIPVEAQPAAKKAEQPAQTKERKIIYYRNPMDPSVTSPNPMKDSMGMDYIAVYSYEVQKEKVYYGCGVKEFGHCPHCDEGKVDAQCICGEHRFIAEGRIASGEEKTICPICKKELKELSSKEAQPLISEGVVGSLSLTQRQIELSGIATTQVKKLNIFKEIRTVGKIAYDPELTIAQEEFLIAQETFNKVSASPDNDVVARAKDLVEKSKFRLRVLGMSDGQIKELEESKESQRNLILPEGKVWVYADIYEYELSWIKEGVPVKVTTQAYPGEEFQGAIRAVNPILDPNTRSVKVRLEIDNSDMKLKPEMFVDVFIQAGLGKETVAVNREAILDTGSRKIVWVDMGEGNFQAREIKTGAEGIALIDNQRVKVFPVFSGLSDGEYVVTKGNFLLDSQSQLTGGMSVLWGGATEIKEETPAVEGKLETQHKH